MFSLSDQAGTPAAPTPPRWNPPQISRGKEKPPTPWGDRQLCQSRKVVRAKVAKSLGIVVSHSRKSRESRSVFRVIVAGRTHHMFILHSVAIIRDCTVFTALIIEAVPATGNDRHTPLSVFFTVGNRASAINAGNTYIVGAVFRLHHRCPLPSKLLRDRQSSGA